MKSCKTCKYFRGISHKKAELVMQDTKFPCKQKAMQFLHCEKREEENKTFIKNNKLTYSVDDYFYCSEESVSTVWNGDFAENGFQNCKNYEQTKENRQFDLFGEWIK